jgi:hypothetical protein
MEAGFRSGDVSSGHLYPLTAGIWNDLNNQTMTACRDQSACEGVMGLLLHGHFHSVVLPFLYHLQVICACALSVYKLPLSLTSSEHVCKAI